MKLFPMVFLINSILRTVQDSNSKQEGILLILVDDESCDYMRKVRVLGELMSCVGLCRFLLSLPKDAYDKAEEAKIICHYYEDEVR